LGTPASDSPACGSSSKLSGRPQRPRASASAMLRTERCCGWATASRRRLLKQAGAPVMPARGLRRRLWPRGVPWPKGPPQRDCPLCWMVRPAPQLFPRGGERLTVQVTILRRYCPAETSRHLSGRRGTGSGEGWQCGHATGWRRLPSPPGHPGSSPSEMGRSIRRRPWCGSEANLEFFHRQATADAWRTRGGAPLAEPLFSGCAYRSVVATI
jgi:hypothetical protein